jgi:hypothetical protein
MAVLARASSSFTDQDAVMYWLLKKDATLWSCLVRKVSGVEGKFEPKLSLAYLLVH